MNELEKLFLEKKTENGDDSYSSTSNHLGDLLFMAEYFSKNLAEVKIGNSPREQLFSMYMRDPRYGKGYRDFGRELMKQSGVAPQLMVTAGRFDDLWKNPKRENIGLLISEVRKGNPLAKKWMPRLTSANKEMAHGLCKYLGISKAQYRALIKEDSTVEYKLSYHETEARNELENLFKEAGYKGNIKHPLVDSIEFDKVPSLAMTKYMKAFATREDTKDRFAAYMEAVANNKAKLNTKTANVHTAYKTVQNANNWTTSSVEKAADVIGQKIIEQETDGVALNCLCILDTSGSMGRLSDPSSLCSKATSVAHALTKNSTYYPNQLISFSRNPRLITIEGNTLADQYKSMFTGEVANTDFGKVMTLLRGLREYPEYLVVLSDMEFDQGSNQSKETTMNIFREHGAKTKIIWWNFNNRKRTSPELDEYGNVYMSGYDLQALLQVPGIANMDEYIDKVLANYVKKLMNNN